MRMKCALCVRRLQRVVEAFNSLASEKLPEAKLKEFVGHTPLQVIAGILLGVVNTFIMYYCIL